MADVSHELDALRFVVESPLSSKVAMFNNQAQAHKNNQLLNPFSNDGRVSPKPQFSKDQYGKPLAGSLTEMRGNKANIHVMKEMLELCQIINSEGYVVKDEPDMRVITFGELFNIYNYISDKCVGILLRARKHKIVDFEGEMLFQRRDDDVPIFLLKPIKEIRQELDGKIEEFKRASSPAPQATSVLLDKSAHEQKLRQDGKLGLPQKKTVKSRTPSPATSRAATPTGGAAMNGTTTPVTSPSPTPDIVVPQAVQVNEIKLAAAPAEVQQIVQETKVVEPIVTQAPPEITVDAPPKVTDEITAPPPQAAEPALAEVQPTVAVATGETVAAESKTDINNNNNATIAANSEEQPTVVIEASAVYVRNAAPAESLVENSNATAASNTAAALNNPPNVNAENVTA